MVFIRNGVLIRVIFQKGLIAFKLYKLLLTKIFLAVNILCLFRFNNTIKIYFVAKSP